MDKFEENQKSEEETVFIKHLVQLVRLVNQLCSQAHKNSGWC